MGKRTQPKVAASPKGKKGKIGVNINELSSCGSASGRCSSFSVSPAVESVRGCDAYASRLKVN